MRLNNDQTPAFAWFLRIFRVVFQSWWLLLPIRMLHVSPQAEQTTVWWVAVPGAMRWMGFWRTLDCRLGVEGLGMAEIWRNFGLRVLPRIKAGSSDGFKRHAWELEQQRDAPSEKVQDRKNDQLCDQFCCSICSPVLDQCWIQVRLFAVWEAAPKIFTSGIHMYSLALCRFNFAFKTFPFGQETLRQELPGCKYPSCWACQQYISISLPCSRLKIPPTQNLNSWCLLEA